MPMLHPLTPADADDLLRLYTEPGVRAFLGGPLSTVEARRRVDAFFISRTPHPVWAIRSAGGDRSGFLGMVSLDPHHDGHDVQISYLLLPEHQGHGHASLAVADALRYAFTVLGLDRVVAETQSRNARSVRLLERVGMAFERRVIRFGVEQSIYAGHAPAGWVQPCAPANHLRWSPGLSR